MLVNEHSFCCTGCSQVYLLLDQNGLCNYYDFEKNPGINAKGKFSKERFGYLDDETIINQLAQFRSDQLIHLSFSLPQMHCSSCVYLLENLSKINDGVLKSQVHFEKKEIFISFNPQVISLKELVALLAFIGYEPDLNLENSGLVKPKMFNRARIMELGVAGFAFSNIMMLSFPEYFSSGIIEEAGLKETFSWIIFGLSLPVLFYSARSIFISAWKGLRQGIVNIDAPIALASIITFGRSYYEIISATGSGYLDSGTGIIFFMLIGRWFQAKTYDAISFDRQYKSYFPLGVTVIKQGVEENIPVTKLKKEDIILLRNEEMLPADALLLEGAANIDYSFVSGEDIPVAKKSGEMLFAGGKQMGAALRLQVIKEPSQSYITQLWNNDVFREGKTEVDSFIHPWSRYFTIILFSIAAAAALYWWFYNPAQIWYVVTAVLIIACPCSLLLSATFTFGNMQRIFGKNKCYLKNTAVIEALAKVEHIVFDKTGTLTESVRSSVAYSGMDLSEKELNMVRAATAQSAHSLSKSVHSFLPNNLQADLFTVNNFKEISGSGLSVFVNENEVQLGSASFVQPGLHEEVPDAARVYVKINENYKGFYEVKNSYRPGMETMVKQLQAKSFSLHMLSGDNEAEKNNLSKIFGAETPLLFKVSPQDKLSYVKNLQKQQLNVLMIGDGLNDAGALKQANCGIAISDEAARFTPACDAILDGKSIYKLPAFLAYARSAKKIVQAGFILSILYNVVGVSFAVQGLLSPLVAAILMPASSISIVLVATLFSNMVARKLGLNKNYV